MKKTIKLFMIALIPVSAMLIYISSLRPDLVEKMYTKNFFMKVSPAFSSASGIFPFSAAEIIVIILIMIVIYYFITTIIKIIKNKSGKLGILIKFIINMLASLGVIYFGFLILWGFNYHRLPFSDIASLDVSPASVDELYEVCEDLVYRANRLRIYVREDKNGCMYIPGGFKSVSSRAYLGYMNASKIYPELRGNYGRPKPVIFSKIMSYEGISGVYFPFTAEANVNISQPDSMLPSAACHEMAHQRGFAREDEANYISYFACSLNPDLDFQYSGTLLALIHSMNALHAHDTARYKLLSSKYSDAVKRDMSQNDEYWRQYEGTIEKISSNINDAYLKSNMQKDGVYSYGRMVDLIIAEYRKNGGND